MSIEPKLRIDAEYSISTAMVEAIKQAIQTHKFIYRNCLWCEHFEENNEMCKIAKARPPARVIAYGCEKFEDMQIPF